MPFLDTNSHLTIKPYNLDIKCQSNSESYDQHGFSGTKIRGGQNLSFTAGGFYNEREYSGADWLVPFICLSVCLSVCSLLRYRLTVFLPPLFEVGCLIVLEILSSWGKVMKRSGLRFEHFSLEVV